MGLGILEPDAAPVQGTIQLFDNDNIELAEFHLANNTANLKHTKDGKILLSPQPSDSPNDPLNHSILYRDFVFGLISLATILSGVHGPILTSVTTSLAAEYNVTIGGIAMLTSYMTLVIAIFSYIFSVIVRVYGKRGVTISCAVVMFVSDAWAAGAKSYGSLMGARVLSGVGQAGFECLSLSLIPDLFFVHERGRRVSTFIFCLMTGVYLSVPIATQIIEKSGLKWAFGGLSIAEGLISILLFIFFEEPAFSRGHVDVLAHGDQEKVLDEDKPVVHTVSRVEESQTEVEPRNSLAYRLNLYHGRFSQQNIFALLWKTFMLTFHPTIFWVALAGLPTAWVVGMSFTIDIDLEAAPYFFTSTGVGNVFIAGFIGSFISMLIGLTSDPIATYLARKNNHVYEPEFRFALLIPATIITVIGYSGWGWSTQVGTPWGGVVTFYGLATGGSALMATVFAGYLIDAHRNLAVESQLILFAMKNFFPFAMGYFFIDWWTLSGSKNCWGTVSGIVAGLALIAIPFYIYGKKMRAYWMKHPFLGIESMDG